MKVFLPKSMHKSILFKQVFNMTFTKSTKGSLTLHLAICFSLLLTLICYTIESSHMAALASHADSVSYFAMDSLFSNYCLPLWEKYGLFALNEQGINLEELLCTYAENNCKPAYNSLMGYESLLCLEHDSIDIKKTRYLIDDDAKDFVSQICKQVMYLELTKLADSLLASSDTDIPEVFEQTQDGLADIAFDSINPSLIEKYISYDMITDGDTSQDLSGINSDSFSSDISESIEHIIKNSLMSCIVTNPASVSSTSIEKAPLPSVTCELTQEGVNASHGYYKDTAKATYEKACFCTYITHTFDNYVDTVMATDNPSDNTASNDTTLRYQTEYIIAGTDSDDTNLLNTALQLISLRTGLNLIHLLSDRDKYNAAWNISQSSSPVPPVAYITQATILTVWAAAEAIIDVRDLLSGKPVPLFKTSEQWSLSLNGLKSFSKDCSSANDGQSGLSYESYLEMLIVFQNNISVYYRTLDLIQMDICNEYSSDFRISKCVTGIDVEFTYSLPYLLISGNQIYNQKYFFEYN